VNFDPSALLLRLSVTALPVILAITLHEAAHGFVAQRCGDDSAFRAGRVTLNPLRHIDLYGTILLPALLLAISGGRFMFGYAKPVPVAFARLRRPRRDMVLVAAAGPATNLALALVSALLLRLCGMASLGAEGAAATALGWIAANLYISILINALLAVFNMIPLPPLDGGRVAVGLLPLSLAVPLGRTERYGIPILIGLVVLVPMIAAASGLHVDLLAYVVDRPLHWITTAMAWVSGMPHD
jgi:Zn-dependent protease